MNLRSHHRGKQLAGPAFMNKLPVTLLVLCGATATAIADGKLSGRVTDVNDQPVKDASVVVTGEHGVEATVTTDPTGHYVATVHDGGSYTVTFAFGKTRIGRRVDIPGDGVATLDGMLELGTEIIEIHDRPKPITYAKPKQDPLAIPPYSDRAVLGDYWGKAWLLLDVDARGVVSRVKFLKRPGMDLDDIAVKHAFGLSFEPARDKFGTPSRSYIVWSLEWPAFGWLQDHELSTQRLPRFPGYAQAGTLVRDGRVQLQGGHTIMISGWPECAGGTGLNQGAIHPALRDCSVPDLSRGDASERWIARDSTVPPPVVADAPIIDPVKLREDQIGAANRYRTSAIVATAGTGAVVIGTVIAYLRFRSYSDRVSADQNDHALLPPGQLASDKDGMHGWSLGTTAFAGGALIGAVVSATLWSHASSDLALQPTGSGASLSYAGKF
jgi:hypothetical protein